MASMLSGPIPQHPMYNKGGVSASPRMGPRVKPEASSFASHGKNGTIANVFEIKGTSCFNSAPSKPSELLYNRYMYIEIHLIVLASYIFEYIDGEIAWRPIVLTPVIYFVSFVS